MTDTLPGEAANDNTPAVVIEATYKDPTTGALYVHHDLGQVQTAWAEEQHVGPPKADEKFGDTESWADYVKHYGQPEAPTFLTWSSSGLKATLDYHAHAGFAGRCQWLASMPFVASPEWTSWLSIAHGRGVAQRSAVEFLDDHSPDVTEPDAASLMAILSSLRASVNKTATTDLRPDGTTSVTWSDQKNLAARGGTADLPPEFSITIPILKGHPTRYKLVVKLRASVDDQAHLALRFTIPQSEQALELVYAAIVQSARSLLGDGFSLLRAAG